MCRAISQGGRRCIGHLLEARTRLSGKLGREGFESVTLKGDETREQVEQELAEVEKELTNREAARERLIERRAVAQRNRSLAEKQYERDVALMKAEDARGAVNIYTVEGEWDAFEAAAQANGTKSVARWARGVLADVTESEDEAAMTREALDGAKSIGTRGGRRKLQLGAVKSLVEAKRGEVEFTHYVRAHLLLASNRAAAQ
jgi:hypothetical protein